MLSLQSYLNQNEVGCKNLFTNHFAVKVICFSRHKKEHNHKYHGEKETLKSGTLNCWC